MELFSELYGCYFTVIAQILRQAHDGGITKAEIDAIVAEKAFSESGLHLIPKLLSGEWDLLEQREDGRYYSKLEHAETGLPLTLLQKSWLKALLSDRRRRLFFDKEQRETLKEQLDGVEPLYRQQDFHVFDMAADGDNYRDERYIGIFRQVLEAVKQKKPLLAEYQKGKGGLMTIHILPRMLQYSAKDDKFRVQGLQITGGRAKPVLLNMARISAIGPSYREVPEHWDEEAPSKNEKRKIVLAISLERNALERCMLQFASYDKQTMFDEERQRHVCEIAYDPMEETELLIRVLSFGPVVQVLEGPDSFTKELRRRVARQLELML